MNLVSAWQNFYVIVGSSGGALVGIQFVVIALIASVRKQADLDSIGAFGTPTVVNFGGALTISAIMSAPWPSLFAVALALGACGLAGFVYALIVFRRARRQKDYQPVGEDWLWYVIFPCGLYVALVCAACFLGILTRAALFMIGGASFGLLLIGIRNAWDSVTHFVVTSSSDATTPK